MKKYEILYIPSGMILYYLQTGTSTNTTLGKQYNYNLGALKSWLNSLSNTDLKCYPRWVNYHKIILPICKEDFEIIEIED